MFQAGEPRKMILEDMHQYNESPTILELPPIHPHCGSSVCAVCINPNAAAAYANLLTSQGDVCKS